MNSTTAARLTSLAAVGMLPFLSAGQALAHSEGLTPYRYVVAPPGVLSEGPAEAGVSTQAVGPAAFAGTTDNQMQLTLPEGALPARSGDPGVRIVLTQVDPATLPPLPDGQEAEGNGYRVEMAFSPSDAPVSRLAALATLGLSAPAAPTQVYELVDGAWAPTTHTRVSAEEGFSSVVTIDGPGTFLQGYAPSGVPSAGTAPGPDARADPGANPAARVESAAPPVVVQNADSQQGILRGPRLAAYAALGSLAALVAAAFMVHRRRAVRLD